MSRTPNPPAIQPAHSFSAMKGSTGESVHSAAVQALMEPGPPHTLRVSPQGARQGSPLAKIGLDKRSSRPGFTAHPDRDIARLHGGPAL